MTSLDSPPEAAAPPRPAGIPVEWSGKRAARRAHRVRLYLYALIGVAVFVYVAALAASNTSSVRVDWVFGSSTVALIWLVVPAAVLGGVAAVLISTVVRWRTRPRRSRTNGS
jgi:uncharacterized integral membrane protein